MCICFVFVCGGLCFYFDWVVDVGVVDVVVVVWVFGQILLVVVFGVVICRGGKDDVGGDCVKFGFGQLLLVGGVVGQCCFVLGLVGGVDC